jgi:hypothetical protein
MLSDAQWEEISSEFNIKPYPHPNSGLPPDFFERRFREALGYCCSGYLYPNSTIDFDHNPKEEVRVLLRLVEKLDYLVDHAKSLEGMNSTDFERIIRRNLRVASGGLEYDPDASDYEITMDAIASLELYSRSAKELIAIRIKEGGRKTRQPKLKDVLNNLCRYWEEMLDLPVTRITDPTQIDPEQVVRAPLALFLRRVVEIALGVQLTPDQADHAIRSYRRAAKRDAELFPGGN